MQGSEVKPGERVKDVRFTADTLAVDLLDGRTIIVPLAWYPKLFEAKPEQRRNWQISGAGYGVIRANDRNREEYTCLPPLTTSR